MTFSTMRPRRSRVWRALAMTTLSLIAVGCGIESSSTETVSGSEVINPRPAGTDLVTCSGWPFPLSALENLEPLESRSEIAEAVRPFLESGEGDYWPQEGWQVITISDTAVQLVVLQSEAQVRESLESQPELGVSFDAGFGDGVDDTIQMSTQSAELVDGTWKWAGSSAGEDCELETPVPEGLSRVEWQLAPATPSSGPNATTIALLATELACRNGEAMGDRFNDPVVLETDTAVLISMTATQPPASDFTCPGNPSTPVTIELASPLGDRELRDGSMTAGRISDYIGDVFGISAADR